MTKKLTQSPEMQVGVMGDIANPTAEYGKQIADECVNGLVSLIDKLEERLKNG